MPDASLTTALGEHGPTPELPAPVVRRAVEAALLEDLGRAGDVTTLATIPEDAEATAVFRAREAGVLCGVACLKAAFELLDGDVDITLAARDGAQLAPGMEIARARGRARALLGAERVALNFLCHMSGMATLTKAFVDQVSATTARICCTRKTVPGLRAFAKHAVRCGGGSNHRFGLDDAILIKDNHIAVCGGVAPALKRARAYAGHLLAIEIEVDALAQLDTVLEVGGAAAVLLDNFTPTDLRTAVARVDGALVLEASGGIDLESVAHVAETAVDFISTSKITQSAPALDIGLDIDIA